MPDSSPTPPPSVIVRRRKLGCLPMGCLLVVILLMLLGVGFGGMMWLISQGGEAYMSEKPALTRTVEPTDEQYQDVLAKLAPLGEALNAGKAAAVEITADDVNVLVARSPQFQFWKGKMFLEAEGDHLTAEVSTRLSSYEGAGPKYFNGRATFDASYASNGFVLTLRRLDPLDKAQANTRFAQVVNSSFMLGGLSQEIARFINDNLRQQARKDPVAADLLRKLRTVVVQDGKIIISTGEVGGATPMATPEPSTTPSSVAVLDKSV